MPARRVPRLTASSIAPAAWAALTATSAVTPTSSIDRYFFNITRSPSKKARILFLARIVLQDGARYSEGMLTHGQRCGYRKKGGDHRGASPLPQWLWERACTAMNQALAIEGCATGSGCSGSNGECGSLAID
ncbi:hypothetical protein D3C77_549350 [compost metagenome]